MTNTSLRAILPLIASRRKGASITTERQIAANRQNALQSTGPATLEGKARSRWNALQHGALAKALIVKHRGVAEEATDFQALVDQLTDDLRPLGALEEMQVERIAVCYWRLARVLRAEAHEIERDADSRDFRDQRPWTPPSHAMQSPPSPPDNNPPEPPRLPPNDNITRLSRYEVALERSLYRAIAALMELQRRRAVVAPPLRLSERGQGGEGESPPADPSSQRSNDPTTLPSAESPPVSP